MLSVRTLTAFYLFHNLRKPHLPKRFAVVFQIGNKGSVQERPVFFCIRKEQQISVAECSDISVCILVLICRDFCIDVFGECERLAFANLNGV